MNESRRSTIRVTDPSLLRIIEIILLFLLPFNFCTDAITRVSTFAFLTVESSGIEPESCNRPFVGFGAVERQSRPPKVVTSYSIFLVLRCFDFASWGGFFLYITFVICKIHNVKGILQIFWENEKIREMNS